MSWCVPSSLHTNKVTTCCVVLFPSPPLLAVSPTALLHRAVAGNYADFIAFRSAQKHGAAGGGSGGSSNSTDTGAGGGGSVVEHQWYTDYAKMSYSALMFYGYVFALGMVLFFALRWFK